MEMIDKEFEILMNKESAINIIQKELINSASHYTYIIIHPVLMDKLLKEVKERRLNVLVQNDKTAGYRYNKLIVYVSSDNLEHNQVIVN